MEFIYEAEFWVAVSFFIFIGVLLYLGVHKRVASALDARALRIGKELDEARRLREEAERLLVDYRRKLGNVVMRALLWRHASHSRNMLSAG
jgi:F-type H+-transporting ATPase subunit b